MNEFDRVLIDYFRSDRSAGVLDAIAAEVTQILLEDAQRAAPRPDTGQP